MEEDKEKTRTMQKHTEYLLKIIELESKIVKLLQDIKYNTSRLRGE